LLLVLVLVLVRRSLTLICRKLLIVRSVSWLVEAAYYSSIIVLIICVPQYCLLLVLLLVISLLKHLLLLKLHVLIKLLLLKRGIGSHHSDILLKLINVLILLLLNVLILYGLAFILKLIISLLWSGLPWLVLEHLRLLRVLWRGTFVWHTWNSHYYLHTTFSLWR
jgi:hypothetical protein